MSSPQKSIIEKAWTCIERWRRRGYKGQVEIFETVMSQLPNWRPIETAPMDQWILVTEETGSRIDQVRWVPVANGEGYNWVTLDGAWQPNVALKYWMPLPEPPK